MKKISILLLLALVCSCSKSDDSSSLSSVSINPPTWIQGVWTIEGSASEYGFIFTSNDFLIKSLTTISYKQLLETNSPGVNTNITEEITNTLYNISITSGASTSNYNFKKITPTKIEWVNDPMGDLVDTFCIKQ
jgi:hypothetical protein